MKLVVGGCSISDCFGHNPTPAAVYGQIVAKKIGADYVHHAAGAGSNYQIWRKITQMVINGEITDEECIPLDEEIITKDDIVIIQYTNLSRQEYFSLKIPGASPRDWSESYDREPDGNIIKFKLDSYNIPDKNKYEKKFFELKEKYFTSIKFDEERFEYTHFLFHNLMISKGIKVAYLVSPNLPLSNYTWDQTHLFNKNGEQHITLLQDNVEYFRHLDDGSIDEYHFGKEGHKYIAMEIEKFIKDNQWQ
jgi:hypothetical protein